MRIGFRAKLFLFFLSALGALLGGALWAVDWITQRQFAELLRTRGDQGLQNFRKLRKLRQSELVDRCMELAGYARFTEELVERPSPEDVGRIALGEIEIRRIPLDLLAIADAEGNLLVRYLARVGPAPAAPPIRRLELQRMESGADPPERGLLAAIAAGEDPQAMDPFLVVQDRLFLVGGFPVQDDSGDGVGVLLFGEEIDDAAAQDLHDYQTEQDQVAFAIGPRLLATSIGGGGRDSAAEAFAGSLPQGESDERVARDLSIGPEPYRALVSAVRPRGVKEPVYAAFFLSLRSLVEFRDQVDRLLLGVMASAIAVSTALSFMLAGQVSAPVKDLVGGTLRIARGEYSSRVKVRSRDELGDLAEAFNQMADDLETKEKARAVLNKVVSREVAEELLRGDLGLSGRRGTATLLFADLRGFTAMTRGMQPEAVVRMLNEFMTAMSAVILGCKGIVDKYVGDEIIGVFGAPRSHGQDAASAVTAAHLMRRKLVEVNAARAARGEPALAMGVGVHTGEVVAGCMGSEELLSYTCIGEAVNLASRLCSNAKPGQILISQATRRDAGDRIELRPLAPILVKGFTEPVEIFEIVEARESPPAAVREVV